MPAEILDSYSVLCHEARDHKNLTHLGATPRGTPCWINRNFTEADLKVVVGNIEPHQFMGFSGGVKSAAIGLAGEETITANHALMMNPESRLGSYKQNPARNDVEELGQLLGVDCALNAVLNAEKRIVEVFAGSPAAVMRAGIPRVRDIEAAQEYDFDPLLYVCSGVPNFILQDPFADYGLLRNVKVEIKKEESDEYTLVRRKFETTGFE